MKSEVLVKGERSPFAQSSAMLGRYFRTIRHLRPEQLRTQVWHRVLSSVERPKRWSPGAVPPTPDWESRAMRELSAPTPGPEGDDVLSGSFRFAGELHQVGWPPAWVAKGATKLWQYNLHYHDWLWGLLAEGNWEAALEGVSSWIERYPLERGAVGWEPYPVSLRLQNWIVLLFSRNSDALRASGAGDEIWASVWKQARRLEARLEYRLLGNHLLENAVTLTLLGATFHGSDGVRWRKKGLTLLRRELAEQILADGTHFELSPMYHLRVMWLLEMLSLLEDEEISNLVADPLKRARKALARLQHPDGEIALLNDASVGIYHNRECGSAPLGAWSLPDAGYYGYRSADGDYLVCDAGRIGPDFIPGHAHADCLSFELSVKGHRVVTDTGVSDYQISESRSYVRSTGAHNTVEIDGQDQAEMWGAFRVGARGYPGELDWETRSDGFRLHAVHSGYERLPVGVTHRREFELTGQMLTIRDRVEGARSFRAIARLHFAPGCVLKRDGETITVRFDESVMRVRLCGSGSFATKESPYYERFGERQIRPMLEYREEVRKESRWEMSLDWSAHAR